MEKSGRKIEWNPDHKSSDEQEMECKMRFLNFGKLENVYIDLD